MNATNENTAPTTKSIREEALAEIRAEKVDEAKRRLKRQLKLVDDARQVLKNEERVLAEMEAEIENGL